MLEATGAAFAQRLDRGRYFARKGVVHDLVIEPGHVGARVRDSRTHPYRVEVTVPTFADGEWTRVVESLAGELRFTARLLDGELPEDIDEALAPAGLELFPRADELDATCTCGETRMPCRHLAAVHYSFAEELDRDPFLLLQLRGRDRGSILAGLRAARSGGEGRPAARPGVLPLADLEGGSLVHARGDLDEVTVHPERVEDPAVLFDRLGHPPGVKDTAPYERMIARAADFAWRLAAGEGSDAADDELLVAELRAQRMSTAASVAEALGWPEERTREALDRLFEAGTVMRTGSGERTRYRA
ncbi:MAG: SWIM zinc finger family protein [Actinobacteria bacterium]|nr:SWIM zinc finger family protein [Actinomycetota bacterium]